MSFEAKNWRRKAKVLLAKGLIHTGQLKHRDLPQTDLQQLAQQQLPHTLELSVPYGNGELTVEQLQLRCEPINNTIQLALFSGLQIEAMSSPLYRAHVIISLEITPAFKPQTNCIFAQNVEVVQIRLLEDDYALLRDSGEIISKFLPRKLQRFVLGSVKSAAGLLSGGVSDVSLEYLMLYTSGSKQRILDYHTPQICKRVQAILKEGDKGYLLDTTDWKEYLFARYGSHISVSDEGLRFHFTSSKETPATPSQG